MDRTLIFMFMASLGVWLIMDNFYGKKYLDTFISNLIGDVSI